MYESVSLASVLKESVAEYKKNFNLYIKFSLIIFGFAILDYILGENPIKLVILLLSIYLTSCADIAMIHLSYSSCFGHKLDFDHGWDYAKEKFWRYFGASFAVGLILIIVGAFGYFAAINQDSVSATLSVIWIFAAIMILLLAAIGLFPYIAAVTKSGVEFSTINGGIIKKNYPKLLLIFFVYAIPVLGILIFISANSENLTLIDSFTDNMAPAMAVLRLFFEPLLICILSRLMYESGLKEDFYAEPEEQDSLIDIRISPYDQDSSDTSKPSIELQKKAEESLATGDSFE